MTATDLEQPTGYQHGTRVCYVVDRCRCLPCRLANANYATELAARHRPAWRVRSRSGWWRTNRPVLQVVDQHGNLELETDDPELAHSTAETLNKTAYEHAENLDPIWAHPQEVRRVREHLEKLQTRGVSAKQVARLAGLDRKVIGAVLGKPRRRGGRTYQQRCRWETADAILAVPLSAPAADRALVPAGETWRLISELQAAGWTKSRIATAIAGEPKPALQIGRDHVLGRTARAVRQLHDREWRHDRRLRDVCACERPIL